MDRQPQLEANRGFLADVFHFVRQTGKWWLVPVVLVILLFGVLLILGGTSAAPFIYSLF